MIKGDKWRKIFKNILKNPENTNMFKRTDLYGWKVMSDAGVIHKVYGEIDIFQLNLEQQYQQGGECDVCGEKWKEIKIRVYEKKSEKEQDVYVGHYEPNCICYPRCVFCNRWLIVERKNKIAGCLSCGKDGIKCWWSVPVTKKDEEGNIIETKKKKKCPGILILQAVQEGCTVMKCSQCKNEIRKEIIL